MNNEQKKLIDSLYGSIQCANGHPLNSEEIKLEFAQLMKNLRIHYVNAYFFNANIFGNDYTPRFYCNHEDECIKDSLRHLMIKHKLLFVELYLLDTDKFEEKT
jgi:hypothetical protein